MQDAVLANCIAKCAVAVMLIVVKAVAVFLLHNLC